MNEIRPTIADVQTRELLYYDKQFKKECYEFCVLREIDCLPAIGDNSKFHRRNDEIQGFDELEISDDRRTEGSTFIFRPDILNQFEEHPLLFVFNQGELTGVIHFSDYNRDAVNTYLFAQISRYERALRSLLTASDLKNEDMINFFCHQINDQIKVNSYKRKKSQFENKYKGKLSLPEFQSFDLIDLIELANWIENEVEVIQIDKSTYDLRNFVAHSVDTVSMKNARTPDYIFEFESFRQFFERVQTMLNDCQRINNRLSLLPNCKEKPLEQIDSQASG